MLSGYTYFRDLTIDHTKIDSDLTDFPILVKLTSSNFSFNKVKDNMEDVRFTLLDDTLLKHEGERRDKINQEAEFWVKVPLISSTSDTVITIQYGNQDETSNGDDVDVWDSNYKMVQHLKDDTASTTKDSTSNSNNGTKKASNEPIEANGQIAKAQSFDGNNDYINCGNNSSLDITSNITLEAWVNKSELNRIESIISKGPYSLKIGEDDKPYIELISGSETINDTGRLGSNTYVYSLVVYDGKLYGGTGNSGRVYRYDGGTIWTDVGQLGNNSMVYSLTVYDGKLYGGTYSSGKVYRYDGGTTWTDVGRLGSNSEVWSLAVYDGKLYGGTYGSSNPGKVYRYDGGTTWTDVGRLGDSTIIYSLAVYDGKLYGGTYSSGRVYRYDGGTTWTDVGRLGSNTYVNSLIVYDGKLYGGTVSSGKVYRYDGETTWTDVGRLGENTYVWSLIVYGGKLYGGTGTSGKVYRYDGGTTWTDIGQLGENTQVRSLTVYDGKLYGGTYNSGRVYSIGSGVAAYSNTALETGNYAHIAGTYDGTTAKIYVNGVETEKAGSITIATKTFNLLIGGSLGSSKGGLSGSGEDYFKGVIDSVRISNTVRSEEWIATEYANQNDPGSFYTVGQEERIWKQRIKPITNWTQRSKLTTNWTLRNKP